MSWKDSPIVVGAITAVSTTLFVLTVTFTAVIPTWTKKYENKTLELSNKVDELKKEMEGYTSVKHSLESKVNELNKLVDRKNKSIAELEYKIRILRKKNVFLNNNVYPYGYREVKIFDSIEKVKKVYQGQKIEEFPGWFSVEVDGPVFGSIAYYFKNTKNGRAITQILFHMVYNDEHIHDIILRQFTDIFGKETTILVNKSEEKERLWIDVNGHNVRIDKNTYFLRHIKYENMCSVCD